MKQIMNTAFLYEYMRENGIKQIDLAKKMSYTRMGVSLWFQKDNFTLKKCLEIVKALECVLIIECSYDRDKLKANTIVRLDNAEPGVVLRAIVHGWGLSKAQFKRISEASNQLLDSWLLNDNIAIKRVNEIADNNKLSLKFSLQKNKRKVHD